MYILDTSLFKKALKNQGFASIGDLAQKLQIHRNTIHYYLSGHGVFPHQLEKMLETLRLKPADVLVEDQPPSIDKAENWWATLADALHQRFPQVTFVAFGSRTENRARAYSDLDVGVFSQNEIPWDEFRKMLSFKEEMEDKLPVFVDLVNLNTATPDFLKNISKGWRFLVGWQQDWLELQRKVIHGSKNFHR